MTQTILNPFFRRIRLVLRTLLAAVLLVSAWLCHAADGTALPETAAQLVDQLQPSTNSPSGSSRPLKQTEHQKRMELIGISIGAVVAPMGLGLAILAVWGDYKKRQNLIKACHEERMAALEKGLELPPYPSEPFTSSDSSESDGPSTGLKPGLVWLGIGIGAVFFLGKLAAIPIGIGVAYLLYYAIEGRKASIRERRTK